MTAAPSHRSPRTRRRGLVAALVVLVASMMLLPGDALQAQSSGPSVERLAGTTRVHTAVAVSRYAFPEGAGTVLLARQDTYPDALAGGPLAAQLGAPILLTHPKRLQEVVAQELRRLRATRVIVLGSEAAVAAPVAEEVRALGIGVERVAGPNRWQTARAIGERVLATSQADLAYLARGAHPSPSRGWADAVAAGPVAAAHGRPVALSQAGTIPEASAELLRADGVRRSIVLGGPAALSDGVRDQARALHDDVRRIGGSDRWQTSLRLAEHALDEGATREEVWIVTGQAFADALTAGPAVAARGGILLLVDGSRWEASPARKWLQRNVDRIDRVYLVGSDAVLPDALAPDLEGGLVDSVRYQLMYSESEDRRDPKPLQGATVRGRVHVFLAVCAPDGSDCEPA